MNKKRLRSIIAVALLIGLGVLITMFIVNRDSEVPVVTAPDTAVVRISEDGFEPSVLTIKSGTVVLWKNDDTEEHRVAANPVATHTDLPDLDSQNNIAPYGDYSFTFASKGTFNYHDELNPDYNATVIVE